MEQPPAAGPAAGLWQRIEDAGLLSRITSHLSVRELEPASLARRSWRDATRSDETWRAICERQATQWPMLKLLQARPGCTRTWRQLFIQKHVSGRTLREDRQPRPAPLARPDRTRFLVAIEVTLPVDESPSEALDVGEAGGPNPRPDSERDWAVLHSSLEELPPADVDDEDDRNTLLVDVPTINESLAHEWGQASGHGPADGKAPLYCCRGTSRVAVTLIRKADGKALQLASLRHQDGCYTYAHSTSGRAEDIQPELDFRGHFSGLRQLPHRFDGPPIATGFGVDLCYDSAGCRHCGAPDGLRTNPIPHDPVADPYFARTWYPPLRCVQCNRQNMRAEDHKVRLSSLCVALEDRGDQLDVEEDGGTYIKSIDGLLEVLDSPHCAGLWA